MAVPVEDTLAGGTKILASWGNSDIRDAINFLIEPPRVLVYNSAATVTLTTGTATLITWADEVFDSDTMHSTVSNTGRLTAATAGTYFFYGSLGFAANATGLRSIDVRKNSAGSGVGGTGIAKVLVTAINNNPNSVPFAGTVFLSATDYIELFGQQTSGGNLATFAAQENGWFGATWISAT